MHGTHDVAMQTIQQWFAYINLTVQNENNKNENKNKNLYSFQTVHTVLTVKRARKPDFLFFCKTTKSVAREQTTQIEKSHEEDGEKMMKF